MIQNNKSRHRGGEGREQYLYSRKKYSNHDWTFFKLKTYFSLFHTVSSRKIPVEIILPKNPSTNTVETLAASDTATDDPIKFFFHHRELNSDYLNPSFQTLFFVICDS